MSKICIFHGNCADGFSGAWVVRRALGPDVEFYPGVYQQDPPDVQGKEVIVVDFSYRRPVMEKIIDQARSVVILDHHKSAAEDLKDLPGAEIIFDMDRAGSMIAWDYYFPREKPPELLRHIQDRDLWKFALPGTQEIQAAVFSQPYNFEVWNQLMVWDLGDLQVQGRAIVRKHFKDIHELLAISKRKMVIGGYEVPVANLPYTMASDAANILAEDQPFAATYYDRADCRVFSLRSRDTGIDVSVVAVEYGGGGHEHASGFSVPRDHPLAR